jgi:choline-sulfatase
MFRRRGSIVAGVVVIAAAALALARYFSPISPLFPADTRVLLVTIDTLRPDALGYVAGRNETPNIDALAASGVSFNNAVTSVPLTLPSHTTMMTGVLPVRHGVRVNGQGLAPTIPTLAEQFHAKGHATAAFVSASVLSKEFGLSRGFDRYDDEASPIDKRLMQRRAAQTFAAARAWIAEQGDKPWFVWVHVYDAHTPYDPPRAFWQPGGERAAYDGAVSYIDNALGPLLEDARRSAGERLLTIVTSDHGEAFGEHGEIEHGIFIYDTTMRVPLVFSYPGVLEPAAPTFTPRLVDLSPTLISGFGWNSASSFDGMDLSPGLRGQPIAVPPAYIESEYPWTSFGWAPLYGAIDGNWKFIDAPQPELYSLADDPEELRNEINSDSTQKSKLIGWTDRTRLLKPLAEATTVDDAETLSRLQSLGYIGAGNTLGAAPEGRPDPKRTTHLRALLRDAESASRAGRIAEALKGFKDVLNEEPDNRFALARLASISIDHGDFESGIKYARATLAVAADQADMQFALADALTRSNQFKEALNHWLEAVRLQPSRTEAWSNLGTTARWLGDHERAISAYKEGLKRAPDSPALLGNLGEVEREAGNLEDAAKHLISAATLEAGATRRSGRIGLVLSELGRKQEAIQWLSNVKTGDDDFAQAKLRLAQLIASSDPRAATEALSTACAADAGIATQAQSLGIMDPLPASCTKR